MISSTSTMPEGINIPNNLSGTTWNSINTSQTPVLAIKEGNIQLGEDFTISVEELIVCVKYLRSLAMKELPEEFI
jgi:hypothetical protein